MDYSALNIRNLYFYCWLGFWLTNPFGSLDIKKNRYISERELNSKKNSKDIFVSNMDAIMHHLKELQ